MFAMLCSPSFMNEKSSVFRQWLGLVPGRCFEFSPTKATNNKTRQNKSAARPTQFPYGTHSTSCSSASFAATAACAPENWLMGYTWLKCMLLQNKKYLQS